MELEFDIETSSTIPDDTQSLRELPELLEDEGFDLPELVRTDTVLHQKPNDLFDVQFVPTPMEAMKYVVKFTQPVRIVIAPDKSILLACNCLNCSLCDNEERHMIPFYALENDGFTYIVTEYLEIYNNKE